MVAKYTLAFYCLTFIKCCGPQIQNTEFKTYHFLPKIFSFLYGNIITFGTQSIIANRTNLQSPCFLVSYAALRLFLKNIWRCTCKTSMMNLKSSLVNRIVVTLITLHYGLSPIKRGKLKFLNSKPCYTFNCDPKTFKPFLNDAKL